MENSNSSIEEVGRAKIDARLNSPTQIMHKLDGANRLIRAFNYVQAQWKKQNPEGRQLIITDSFRTDKEQNALYAKGRVTAGPIVTNAKAGQSKHNSYPSKAIDIAFIDENGVVSWPEQHYVKVAEMMLSYDAGITWGGNFKTIVDKPHFEI